MSKMLKVRQVKIDVLNDNETTRLQALCQKLHLRQNEILDYQITKQSLDARDKEKIMYVYEFNVKLNDEQKYLKIKDVLIANEEVYQFPYVNGNSQVRPVIIGCGPAGLFCAYVLAENGFHPIVIEQGEKMEKRIKTVNHFWETGILNANSNVQFGEGGAGTFSDGKLNTMIKNENHRHEKVFNTFVEHGAPSDILYSYKPHIGTDCLSRVIVSIRKKIEEMGGSFYFEKKLTDIVIDNNHIKEIILNDSERFACDFLVLALGHSSRDTFHMLYEHGLLMESKPFAVGLRVSHRQKMINESQYGKKYADKLGSANYKLTYQSSHHRGVYSFCMCPGGYVVNASSVRNQLVINGMSNYLRDSENANSAIVVTVSQADFGPNPLDGVKYQESLEKAAYGLGNGLIPVQLYKDYQKKQISNRFLDVNPLFKGKYTFGDLNKLFSEEINSDIKEAMTYFGKKIKGFDSDGTILAAVESRTSSPIKMFRDECLQSNIKGIFPCGEGAGYAGGITSSAIDGIKVAEMVAKLIINQ